MGCSLYYGRNDRIPYGRLIYSNSASFALLHSVFLMVDLEAARLGLKGMLKKMSRFLENAQERRISASGTCNYCLYAHRWFIAY
jgi:hypothetical protein